MKLFVLKLISLVVLVLGGVILAACFDVPEAKDALQCTHGCLVKNVAAPGGDQPSPAQWAAGAILLLVGLYGFLPRLPKRDKRRTVAYNLEHGDVVVALDPAQTTLNEVIKALPEVKKICIKVTAAEDRRKVKIDTDAVLNAQLETTAQESRDLINQCILDTATNLLGLEVLGPINLKVKGAEVDVKAASEKLRAQHLAEIQAKKEAAPAMTPLVLPPSAATAKAPDQEETPEDIPATAPDIYTTDTSLTSILDDDIEKTGASLDTGFLPEALPEDEVFPAGDEDEEETPGTADADKENGGGESEDETKDDDGIRF